jgi:Flp pilus assembly pilin Flp
MLEMVTLRRTQGHCSPPTHRRKESSVNSRRWQNGLDGQGLVEYSLVLIFVALVIFSALAAFGPLLTGFFDKVAQSFPA